MGACLGKPLADGDQQGGRRKHKGRHKNAAPEEPEELVFANEKPPEKGAAEAQPQQRNGEIAEGSNAGGGEATGGGNGAGSAFGAGGGGRAGLSPFEDPRNKVFESPAMSVMGTPAIHLSNFSPAPATFDGLAGSILQQAAEKARVSRLRDDERGKQMGAAEGAAGGGNQIPVGVVVGGGGGGGFGAAAGAGSAGAGSSGGSGEGHEGKELNKKFGYARNINAKYELEHEVGRGHFGHTCAATGKKGEVKGVQCAIKVIPKANMTTVIAVEDVKREVRLMRALGPQEFAVRFFDAYEDQLNVYIAMELCEGGELLERLLQRGGKYPEHEAREVMRQILNIIAFLHQQGVVHRDLKPENFLFKSRDEGSALRAIDFGLSDFVRPDQKLNDIVGSAYYIAPEVLHRAYGTEADVWSVGVIAYILLSGSRPFWARTESGIFRAVLRLEPNLIDAPWPAVSHAGRDFVHRLLTKDYRRRPTAAQALTHPWIRSSSARIPLDIAVYKSLRAFFSFSPLRRAGLKALVPTLTEDELVYLRAQFGYMDVDGDGLIDFNDLKNAMQRVATDAMRESHTIDLLKTLEPARISRMPFTDFCAAALNVFQLEALPNWPERARVAYQTFVRGGKAHVTIDELVKELGQVESMANAALLDEWTNFDGTVSFLGFTRLVHGPSRARKQRHVRAKPKPSVSPTSSGRVKHPPGVPEMKPIPEDGGEGRAAQGSGVLGQGQAGVQQHQQQQGQQQQQSHQEQVQADMHSFKPYQQQQPPQASGEGVGMDATAAVAGLGIPMFQSSQQQQQPHMGALGDGGRSGGSASGGNRLGASRLGGSGSRGEAMSGGTGGSVSEGMDAQRAVGEYGGGVVGSSHGEGESAVRQAKGVGSIPDGVMSAEEAVAAGGL
ncbi:unnamed protein product [Closterium sp. NIES-64]|nr:unnamed protein product [Closterium sp. NIES-64]